MNDNPSRDTPPNGAARVESAKNTVELRHDVVVKTFKHAPGGARRAKRESIALRRMAGVPGVPVLLEFAEREGRMRISRLPGTPLHETPAVPDEGFHSLRRLVNGMLERGVARRNKAACAGR